MLLRIIAILAITALVGMIAVFLAAFLLILGIRRDVDGFVSNLNKASAALYDDSTLLSGTIRRINETMLDADVTISHIDGAAQQAQSFYPRELREVAKATAAAKDLLDHTDISLNRPVVGTIPVLTASLTDLDHSIVSLNNLALEARPAVQNLTQATLAANQTLSDPAIHESLAHLNATLNNTQHVTADAKTASDIALAKLREALAPERFMVRLGKWLLGLAPDGISSYWYITH